MKNKKGKNIKIKNVRPSVVLKGGLIEIETSGAIPAWDIEDGDVMLGSQGLRIIGTSPHKLIGEVLYFSQDEETLPLYFQSENLNSKEYLLTLPTKISDNHILGTSPVSDPLGNIFFIDLKELQKEKQSVIYQYSQKTKTSQVYLSGIPAPTSLAYFDGVLWVTSMVDRKLYRCVGSEEVEVFSQGLGSVFGLAVNSLGEVFVGDQTGSLFKVDATGRASFYASLPETFKGYHFAFSPDDELFVSIPSSVGKNYIYKVTKDQETVPYLETMNILGGMCFSPSGELYWIENSREEGLLYKMDHNGEKEKMASAGFLLGVHFTAQENLVLTDLHNIYMVEKESFNS